MNIKSIYNFFGKNSITTTTDQKKMQILSLLFFFKEFHNTKFTQSKLDFLSHLITGLSHLITPYHSLSHNLKVKDLYTSLMKLAMFLLTSLVHNLFVLKQYFILNCINCEKANLELSPPLTFISE